MSRLLQTNQIKCDILIAGGGPAGVPCALAAARNGAQVILCQDRPVLGGNASSEIRMHIVGANGTGHSERGEELLTEAREGGIIEELRLENCVRNPQRSPSLFDLILYDKCRQEPNLTLMLNTTVVGAETEQHRVTKAIAVRHSTEDRFEISADVFIDCTGDGRLAAEAGAAYLEGREDKEQFGETLAQKKPDAQRLGSTILIQARQHDRPMPFIPPDWIRHFTKEDLKLRLYATPGDEAPTHEYGYWWAEWGGTLDTIKQNEEIRDELLAITLGIWNHIKNGPPGTPPEEDPFEASHWALEWCGFVPGKRESRRFIGQHLLTEADILSSEPFEDAIAYGGWSLDLHPPAGVDAPEEEPCVQHDVPHLYDIPLKACIARDIENLMFAGRNISATHVAFSSTRVMATCATMGQGVGTAAAYAVKQQMPPGSLPTSPKALQAIQQQLLYDDAYLIGKKNDTSDDLIKSAQITASSEQPQGEAVQLISGQTRAVHGKRGAPKDRAHPALHRWMSSPEAALPAWVEFQWDEPVRPVELHLIFDTGLHRHLTLSQHDGYTSQMHWGFSQPETVADYEIQIPDQEGWRTIHDVQNNYQRLRRHKLQLTHPITSLRILVTRTNGLDHARICEVRCYAEGSCYSEG